MNKEVIKISEAATALGVGRGRAYQLARQGLIPTIRRGRSLVIPRIAWEEFMRQQSDAALASMSQGERYAQTAAA